jgi:hypothetical protein
MILRHEDDHYRAYGFPPTHLSAAWVLHVATSVDPAFPLRSEPDSAEVEPLHDSVLTLDETPVHTTYNSSCTSLDWRSGKPRRPQIQPRAI